MKETYVDSKTGWTVFKETKTNSNGVDVVYESIIDPKTGETYESARVAHGSLSVAELTQRYCRTLFEKFGTYQEVARRTGLDRRTFMKLVDG